MGDEDVSGLDLSRSSRRESSDRVTQETILDIEKYMNIPNIQHDINIRFSNLWWTHTHCPKIQKEGFNRYYLALKWHKTSTSLIHLAITQSLSHIDLPIIFLTESSISNYMSSKNSNNIAVSRYETSYGKLINYVLIPHTRPLYQDYITFFLEISHHLKLHITKLIKSRLVHSTSVTSVEINPPTKHDWSTNNYTIIDLSNIIMYVNYDTSEDTNRSTIPDYTESKTTYTCNKTTYPKEIQRDVKYPQISRLSSTYINSDIQLQFLTLELAHVRQQLHYKTLEVNEQALVIQRQSVEIGILKNKQIEQQAVINNITSVYLSARE